MLTNISRRGAFMEANVSQMYNKAFSASVWVLFANQAKGQTNERRHMGAFHYILELLLFNLLISIHHFHQL